MCKWYTRPTRTIFSQKNASLIRLPKKKQLSQNNMFIFVFFWGYPATMAGKNKGVTGEQTSSWVFTPFGSRGL